MFADMAMRLAARGQGRANALMTTVSRYVRRPTGLRANDRRFAGHPLGEVDLLAAWQAGKPFGEGSAISIEGIAGKPLLVFDASYIFRRTFDAACRLAKVEPNIVFESRTPHAPLAMAESGHGIAVIPSTLRTHWHSLRIASVTYRGMALREPLAIFWN